MKTPTLEQRNLIEALRQGLIDWFQFFEMWRKTTP